MTQRQSLCATDLGRSMLTRRRLHRLATREPHSFHQTTIYYGLVRQDTPPRRKYGLLTASIGIVFLSGKCQLD